MENVLLTAPDGPTSTARYFPAAKVRASLLLLPAMGVNARAYDAVGAALAGQGVATLVAEHRGGESSSVRPRRGVDFGYRELLADLDLQRRALLERVPGLPVNVLGHSMGGHVAVLGVPRWQVPGARLVVVASGSVHFRAWRGAAGLGLLASAWVVAAVARTLGVFPGHRLGFGGLQGRSLMVEWARMVRTGEFRSEEGPLEEGLDAPGLEVLAVCVEGDGWVPRGATERLVGKLPGARVRWEALDVPAEPARLRPHFRWARAPEALAAKVADFLAPAGGL
jgi:predicted alpha/beta hydrolase